LNWQQFAIIGFYKYFPEYGIYIGNKLPLAALFSGFAFRLSRNACCVSAAHAGQIS
jgi:hypothetical protein